MYRGVVARKRKSVTAFVLEAVEEKLSREKDEELRRGFESLAGPIDHETRAWIEAQRAAMGRVNG